MFETPMHKKSFREQNQFTWVQGQAGVYVPTNRQIVVILVTLSMLCLNNPYADG